MATIPQSVVQDATTKFLAEQGFSLIHQGKVRNTFRISKYSLLVVATDRISIFDFVLPALVPQKGEILTALTHFWLNGPIKWSRNHLFVSEKDHELNAIHDLVKKHPGLKPFMGRCLVVRDLTGYMDPFELIFRAHLGGSVYKGYEKTGTAAGHKLEPGLPKWSKLRTPLFTPSTKEDVGHDINVDAQYYFEEMQKQGVIYAAPWIHYLTKVYSAAYRYAADRGIIILDTKFEGSGEVNMLADEILTPDSSRFCEAEDWKQAMIEKRDPQFMDKEVIRKWGRMGRTPFGTTGIKDLKPENEEHLAFVNSLEVPQRYIDEVASTYHKIFERLTGKTLERYQKENMGIE